MSKIKKVVARQVYDSRGNPTIEAEVFSNKLSASAICPSGASTGTFEAYEKRDKSNKKYLAKSVLIPVATVNKLTHYNNKKKVPDYFNYNFLGNINKLKVDSRKLWIGTSEGMFSYRYK